MVCLYFIVSCFDIREFVWVCDFVFTGVLRLVFPLGLIWDAWFLVGLFLLVANFGGLVVWFGCVLRRYALIL